MAGSSRLEPVGQKLPGEQRSQAVALSALWNVPSAQSVHRLLRGDGAYEPAAHGSATVEPSWQNVPEEHSLHASALPRSVALPCVPSGHGSGADDPGRQYEPSSHARHAVAFALGCRFPASHAAHSGSLPTAAYVPGRQGAAGRPPPAHSKPGSQSKHSGSPSTSDALA